MLILQCCVKVNHSVKKDSKGEVTASFEVFPNSDPISSNAITTFPNSSTSTYTRNWPSYGFARVYARDHLGKPKWYALVGSSNNRVYLYEDAPPGQGLPNDYIAYFNTYYGDFHELPYIPTDGDYDYIITASHRRRADHNAAGFRLNKNNGTSWQMWNPYTEGSPPIYDKEDGVWYSVQGATSDPLVMKESGGPFWNNLGQTSLNDHYGSNSGWGVLEMIGLSCLQHNNPAVTTEPTYIREMMVI